MENGLITSKLKIVMLKPVAHKIDLHCHTSFSDGSLELPELLAYVSEHKVKQLAITDHDSIGVHIARKNSPIDTDIDIIPGIEISCAAANREIHVVGLNIQVDEPNLVSFVEQQQDYRRARLIKYADKLEKLGLPGMRESVQSLTSESVTRAHLAQLLVKKGIVPDTNRAFKRWIGHKAKAYVAAEWPEIELVIERIKGAGGIAVLAHPGRYPLSRSQLKGLIERFASGGGEGIELSYPNIDPHMAKWLTSKAVEFNLLGSQGSDFHNPEWRWVKPGWFPPISNQVQPVWEHWN